MPVLQVSHIESVHCIELTANWLAMPEQKVNPVTEQPEGQITFCSCD